jgi:branched-chain amino acid transport system substrate-binding protein
MENTKNKPVAKIGFGLPYDTPHDATGYCAAELAILEANERDDLPFFLELKLVNDERNVDRALVVSKEFCEDPAAVGMLGPLNSPMSHASQHVYHQYGMAQISSEPISPGLTEKGYENYFRLLCKGDVYARLQARVAVEYIGAKRIVVINDGDPNRYDPLGIAFFDEAKKLGCEPLLMWKFGDSDRQLNFDPLVETVKSQNPDLVYFAVYWNPSHIIAHQLRYKKCSGVFLGTDALKHIPYLEVYGLDPEPPYHTFNGVDVRLAPSCREFFKKFAVLYPHTLVNLQYAPEGYDMTNMMIEAIKRAGVIDRTAVLHEIQKMGQNGFDGLIGKIRFNKNGDLIDPEVGLYRCIESLRHYIGPVKELLK